MRIAASTAVCHALIVTTAIGLGIARSASANVAAVPGAGPQVTMRRVRTEPITPYRVVEFAVDLQGGAGPYANPYDPDVVAVDATLHGPHGQTLTVPGFWYEPYRRSAPSPGNGAVLVEPTGDPAGWRVRVALPTPGAWTVTVTARDSSGAGSSGPVLLTVSGAPDAANAHGFVQPAAPRHRYFRFDDGSSYFLVGQDVGWAGARGLADFDDWFGALGRAGGNYARVWMAWLPLESKATGLGRYDQKNAAYYDDVLAIATRDHIRCLMSLGTYGELLTGGYFNEGQWPNNPYSTANGGPVPADKPNDIFTNPEARKLYRHRLRYLIARYSAYTSLGFWEFWNEDDSTPPWLAEMGTFVKQLDPYRRPVTNSYSTVGPAAAWNLPQMDLTQTHRYGSNDSPLQDPADVFALDARDHDVYGKPHLVGEFGISWQQPDTAFDPNGTGTNLHNGLWAGALSGDAGGACLWWWDNYVGPKNLWWQYTGLARFVSGIDWAQRQFTPLDLPAAPLIHLAPGAAAVAAGSTALRDLMLTPTGGWGEIAKAPIVVLPDGRVTGGSLPSTFMSPDKPTMHGPLTLNVDLPQASALVLRIGTVSNASDLKVTVDGQQAADLPFFAAPGHDQDYRSTVLHPEYGGIYQAVFDRDRSIPIPAGRHSITILNVSGDWTSITSYTLKNAHDPRRDTLRPFALEDARTGETLLWLLDPDSNWMNDRDPAYRPRPLSHVDVELPLSPPGRYRVTWWDTRAGIPMASAVVHAAGNGAPVHVASPTFTRDIVLHAVRIP
jgi:hypothetical protein